MRAPLASLCFAALALAAPPAGAQASASALRKVTAQLDYQLRDGAEGRCPDAAFLRREIAAELGFDAFAPDATGIPVGRVRVTVKRTARGFAAQVDYEDTDGKPKSTLHYPVTGSSNATCEILVDKFVATDVASELTIPVEEPAAPPPPPAPPPAPAPPAPAPAPRAPTAPAPASPAPPRASSLRPRFEVGLGILGSIGTGAHPTLGSALHLGLSIAVPGSERSRLLFAVEGRADAPTADAHAVQAQLFAGSGVICGLTDVAAPSSMVTLGIMLCALGRGGVLRESVQDRDRYTAHGFVYGAAGARLGLEARFGSLLAVRPQIEVLPTLGNPDGAFVGHRVPIGGVAGSMGLVAALLF